MSRADWGEGFGGGNSQLTTAVQTPDSKSTSGVADPEDTENESSEAMLSSLDQNRDWHAWVEPQSSGGLNSPPWRRLGPPSNAGDATSHEAGLSSLWSTSGAVAQCATRIWSSAAHACASSLAAAQAWLTAEETPPSRYVALIPLSGMSGSFYFAQYMVCSMNGMMEASEGSANSHYFYYHLF